MSRYKSVRYSLASAVEEVGSAPLSNAIARYPWSEFISVSLTVSLSKPAGMITGLKRSVGFPNSNSSYIPTTVRFSRVIISLQNSYPFNSNSTAPLHSSSLTGSPSVPCAMYDTSSLSITEPFVISASNATLEGRMIVLLSTASWADSGHSPYNNCSACLVRCSPSHIPSP